MGEVTLGLAGEVGHDPAAALFVDGRLAAAVEEERLLRRRHARGELPYRAARACLEIAGLRPSAVTRVAIPCAPTPLFGRARWHYARRHWYAPDRSLDVLFNGNRRYRRHARRIKGLLERLHIPSGGVELVPVPHQLAHAASGYLLSENQGKAAIFCADAWSEYAAVFLGVGEAGEIRRVKEFHNPDSLCGMYAALTDYLGFEKLDGEFKAMGIAPFGDPDRYDLSRLARFDGRSFSVDNRLVAAVGLRRYRARSRGHSFSRRLVDWLGPRRAGNLLEDPYVHYAAAIQKLYEDIAAGLVEHWLGGTLAETGRLVVAGTGAMNIRLNSRLAAIPAVRELVVHPACGDPGTAVGAAAWAARAAGVPLEPLRHMYLGPRYDSKACAAACDRHPDRPSWERLDDPHGRAAALLAAGRPVAWFRGAMEFGPRALGHRSILASPVQPGVIDAINRQVKFRERWRPYSASALDAAAAELLPAACRDEFMCLSSPAGRVWRERYPELAHRDGAVRLQVVRRESSPDFHRLLACFQRETGHGVLINTALCRPGEPMACSPEDALEVFMGTDLDCMILEDLLVAKREAGGEW